MVHPTSFTTTTPTTAVTITTSHSAITEPSTANAPGFAHSAWVTLTLSTPSNTSTTIAYTLTGTATRDADYTLTPDTPNHQSKPARPQAP